MVWFLAGLVASFLLAFIVAGFRLWRAETALAVLENAPDGALKLPARLQGDGQGLPQLPVRGEVTITGRRLLWAPTHHRATPIELSGYELISVAPPEDARGLAGWTADGLVLILRGPDGWARLSGDAASLEAIQIALRTRSDPGQPADRPSHYPPPVLPGAGEQTFLTLRDYLAARAKREGWHRRPGHRPTRGQVARRRLRWLSRVVVTGVLVALISVPWMMDLAAVNTRPTASAEGTVTAVLPAYWLPLTRATVEFTTAAGQTATATPPAAGLAVGDRVTVRYVVDDPAHARLRGETDGMAFALSLTLVAGVLLVTGTGYRLTNVIWPSLVGSSPGVEPVRMRYLRVRDPFGGDGIVLFDTLVDSPPRSIIGVEGTFGPEAPLSGLVDLASADGHLDDGEWVHPTIGGETWLAATPVRVIPADEVDEFCRAVLTGSPQRDRVLINH